MLKASIIIQDCFKGSNEKYRSDIDGLRALACLAVVIYHAFPESLRGGFTGVDIFFVISGFLILSILYRNLYNPNNPGRVNIVDFYVRRVKRILPALICVLLFVLTVGYFLLLPNEYQKIGKHVLGGSTYISNFILYFESGDYFNQDSNQKPLLHLWSLGVEEQFYLIFPLFLWLIYKLKLSLFKSLVVFASISFVINIYSVLTNHGSYAFYMPWARFWELSLGSILAYMAMFKHNWDFKLQQTSGRLINSNLLSIVGVLLIVIGYFVIKSSSKFPGFIALSPVVGSVCIIAAGPKAFINRYILSSKICIFLGLISYPLYLWHWPVLSLAYTASGMMPNVWIRVLCVLISIILAILTFYFVEPPLRYGRRPALKSVILSVLLLVIGIGGYALTNNINSTYTVIVTDKNIIKANQAQIIDEVVYINYGNFEEVKSYSEKCKAVFPHWTKDGVKSLPCLFTRDDGFNDIAIIGDSHAAEIAPLFIENLQKQKQDDLGDHSLVCLPSAGQAPFINVGSSNIDVFMNNFKDIIQAFDYVLKHDEIKTVLLFHYPNGSEYDVGNSTFDLFDSVYHGALRTFEMLANKDKKVIVVLDHPSLPYLPIAKTNNTIRNLLNNRYSFDKVYFSENVFRNEYNAAVIKAASSYHNVKIVDISSIFCDKQKCYSKLPWNNDGQDVYRDLDHLNRIGAKAVVEMLMGEIEKAF